MANYLSSAEVFVLVWLIASMCFMAIVTLCIYVKDIKALFTKTPEQRATDWVNAHWQSKGKH